MNEGNRTVAPFAWNVDWQEHRQMQSEMPLFHARFRQAMPPAGEPFVLLETRGEGHYLGCHLDVASDRPLAWGGARGHDRVVTTRRNASAARSGRGRPR